MARRIGLLVTAVVLALFGAASLLTYANGSTARAAVGQNLVSVLVVSKAISAGTAADKIGGSVELRPLPKSAVPAGALTVLTSLTDQVTAQDLPAGQVLLPAQFTAKQLAGSLRIPDGKLAMSIEMQEPQRVAGFVLPGSQVAVFVTYAKGGSTTDLATRLLISKVQVIAVGPTALSTVGGTSAKKSDAADGPAESKSTALITVAVDAGQALKMVQASQAGTLHFALLSDTSKISDGSPAVDNSSLFN